MPDRGALDRLLAGTGARWVGDGQRLGPDHCDGLAASELPGAGAPWEEQLAQLVDRGRVPGAPGQTDALVWTTTNRLVDLAAYRWCWAHGIVAVPVAARAGAAAEADARARLAAAELPADTAAVLWTAGSTGRPKGVVHTHASLAHKARQMVGVHGLTAADVVLMPAPLSHMSGLLNGLLVPGCAGMTTVLMARWDPAAALDLIEAERVSFMVGPPTFFLDLWRAPTFGPERVASLRLVSCGGTDVSEAFVHEAAGRLGCVVKRTYGSTEAPTVTTTPATEHGDPRAATTEGRPLPGVEVRTVAADGRPPPPGEPGELLVRGPELFAGYLDRAETDAALAPDGWFHTGDLARIDADGWVTVVGRVRDLIIRGGENLAPGAIEAVLEAHPDVTGAVVVGVPDRRLGERVGAAVTLAPGATLDLAACAAWFEREGAGRTLAPEHLVVLEALPRLASGKPDRAAVRARLATPSAGMDG